MKSSGRKKGGSKHSNFLIQGSILAAAGIIVRLIGMLYRIPLASKIGNRGIGYYSAAYSVYSILLIMSSYSLPVAVSKMVAGRIGQRRYKDSVRILKASLFYATIAGSAAALILWFGADFFANAIQMPYSSYALKSLAPTIWIMSYLGVLRGYFQGHGTMIPTAVSQIMEQVINAVVSLVAAGQLYAIGLKSNMLHQDTEYAFAYGAAGGTIGTGAGALTALVIFLALFMLYRPVIRQQQRRDRTAAVESYKSISYTLCLTILPIIVSSVVYNISSVIDNFLFGNAMLYLGQQDLIADQWGVYMGKYHLLFNIPVAIANSLSSSLIPALSRTVAERQRKPIISKVSMVIRFSMMIAIPSSVGLAVMAGPVSNLLFRGEDNTMLIRMTIYGSAAVLFFSLSTVTNGVLQGINKMQTPIINAVVALGIHTAILALFLYVLKLGIYSVLYSNVLFALTVCILNQLSIRRYLRYRQELRKTFLIPALSSVVMGGAAYVAYQLSAFMTSGAGAGASNLISTLVAIMVAIVVYGVLMLKLKGINRQELSSMPGGRKIIRAAVKLHLM